MKTNKEIRKDAREILRGGWFGRLLIVTIAMYAIVYGAQALVLVAANHYGVPLKSVPLKVFSYFVSMVFGSITAFGLAGSMLKAAQGDHNRWFGSSFAGFSRPLELTWFLAVMNARVILWTLLLIVPGIIAIYRYRQAWYLKNQNLDWSVWKCLEESGRMMKGYKERAFYLDLSYLGWFLLTSLGIAASMVLTLVGGNLGNMAGTVIGAAGWLVSLFTVWLFCWVVVYALLGRAVFYREQLKDLAGDSAGSEEVV